MENQFFKRELLTEKWIEPSYISTSGDMYWYNKYGEQHSAEGRPAIIWSNRDKCWYKNGQIHRDGDKPAVIYPDGEKRWYKNGEFIK